MLDALQGTDPKLRLRNLSCSGEDLTTIMQGPLRLRRGQPLAQALVFLRAHRHTTGLVTLTIGGNDVRRCVRGTTIDMACISTGMANVSQRLPQVLTALRQAAPRAQVVVTNYYNPYLAAWFTNRTVAAQSQVLAAMLNAVIAERPPRPAPPPRTSPPRSGPPTRPRCRTACRRTWPWSAS